MSRALATLALILMSSMAMSGAFAADLVALSAQTWDRYAPEGKEVDAIHGDFVLANDNLLAVVAHPKRGRHANMTVRDVGGCLIDLTRRDRPSDQLSAFYPGAQLREYRFAGIDVEAPSVYEAAELDRVFVKARRVTLRLVAVPAEGTPDVELSYTIEDGWPYVLVTTTLSNRTDRAIDAEWVDSVRADRSFEKSPAGVSDLFWAYDHHWGQAYGVVPEGRSVLAGDARALLLRYPDGDGKVTVRLEPGQSSTFARRVIPGANTFDVRSVADRLSGRPARAVTLNVKSDGQPVAGAEVTLERDGTAIASGRTHSDGSIEIDLGQGPGRLTVAEPSRGKLTREVAAEGLVDPSFVLPAPGGVVARIVDAKGGPIPCKVAFAGREGTPTPDFGPTTGEHSVKNLVYSQNGTFRRELPPGSYDVIVSYGPEHDAMFQTINVQRGKDTALEATLVRSVRTDGWISADFHSHSSPSGDNTSSQYGRVLNLLCEQIEFAPCTEHNRISTYDDHLKRLGVERLMATCSGMELTGRALPLNHQNAFPLVYRPGLQDNGAPTTDDDPEIQIERLALWDGASEKLVQVNHPDLGWMFFDRDGDGVVDSGFPGMAGRMDVVEVHPPDHIFRSPMVDTNGRTYNNTMHNWLQLLNLGRRIPGVVNTDAHENYHGSGWLRNYLKSPTDDPAEIRTLDVVRAAEKGHVVMTNGPFLEVSLGSGREGSAAQAGPGDDLAAPGGEATLHVRVQCPNWFDVDRVQVFVNGVAVESLNFTRSANKDAFAAEGALKFDRAIPLKLQGDAHVIVAAIGEATKLGPVMGPEHQNDRPVAVSNPIFVDVDGKGFQANKDSLGTLPVKGGR